MDKDTFTTGDATIELEKVAAFEEVPTPDAEATLNVYLTNGAVVPVRGDDEVQGFVEAIEEHLEDS